MASNFKPKRNQTISSQRTVRQSRVKQADLAVSPFIKLVRLMICGLGVNAIIGTTISVINPRHQTITKKVAPVAIASREIASLKLTKPSLKLTEQLQAKLLQTTGSGTAKKSTLDASYIFVETDSGEYSELGSDRVLPAASTIKLPILIALFQDIDAQKIKLTEQLTISDRTIAGGSGDLRNKKPGSQVSVIVAATKMMTISDNTATNILIDRLGGKAALNQRFRTWGLKVTTINQPLPDLKGTNTTTAKELTRSILAIQRGKIVSESSRAQIINMMSHTSRNTMLPKGLGVGAKIAHKTGDIGTLVADVGSIESPSGKKYLAAVLVKRPHNSPAGPELIRQMSKVVYDYFEPVRKEMGSVGDREMGR
jgi:beta-lactamase class A